MDENLKRELHLVSLSFIFETALKKHKVGLLQSFTQYAQKMRVGASIPAHQFKEEIEVMQKAAALMPAIGSDGKNREEMAKKLSLSQEAIDTFTYSKMANVLVRIMTDSLGDSFIEVTIPKEGLSPRVREGFREIGAEHMANFCDMLAARP